jgi:hypothetical protein
MNADQLKREMGAINLTVPDSFWGHRQLELIGHILTEPVDNFLLWPEVASTMFVGDCGIVLHEFYALQAAPDWSLWREIIRESGFGGAPRLPYAEYTSGNLVHQAYHLMRWQNATGRRVSDLNTIVEIGGGYGALAMLARRAGFAGRYVIIDLPTFGLLQKYYLAESNVEAEWAAPGDKMTADLAVGLWSLSEMTPTDQVNALSGIEAGGYLVAGCGELGIPQIEQAAQREAIEHLLPNSYWLM